jgi:hypothetical protein
MLRRILDVRPLVAAQRDQLTSGEIHRLLRHYAPTVSEDRR